MQRAHQEGLKMRQTCPCCDQLWAVLTGLVTGARSMCVTSSRHSQCLTFQAQINLTAQPYKRHDWLWPHHFGNLFPVRHPPNRTGDTEQGRKRLGADHGGSACMTDGRSSIVFLQRYRWIPVNGSDRPADDRAVCGSRCCAGRDISVRWRQSLSKETQYELSRKRRQ